MGFVAKLLTSTSASVTLAVCKSWICKFLAHNNMGEEEELKAGLRKASDTKMQLQISCSKAFELIRLCSLKVLSLA